MLRIGICDDSAEARLGLRAMLERLLDKRAVECQNYEFSSGEGLLGWMESTRVRSISYSWISRWAA